MEILGRRMNPAFDRFYASVESELIPITYDDLAPGRRVSGESQVYLRKGLARVWLKSDLPDEAHSHVAAHEVCHVLQTLRGFDKLIMPKARGSREGALQGALAGAVECTAVDKMIGSFGLDSTYSVGLRFNHLRTELLKLQPPCPQKFTDPFVMSVLAYVRSAREQPDNKWRILRRGFKNKRPQLAAMAEDFLTELEKLDLQDRDDRRKAFLLLRDGLRLEGTIEIHNPLEAFRGLRPR